MISLTLAAVAYGSEYNFYEQADKKGCSSSITERGQTRLLDGTARTSSATHPG
jgi:hypothetical protein